MNENDKQAEPVAQPYAHIYEFDSAVFGTHRSFSPSQWNGMKPTRTVAVYTHPPQPVQPAGAQGEAVDLRELFERLLFGTYAGKDSYYNDEQIKHGCFERAQELVDVAKRMNIALYTAPPAAAINEQLLKALRPFAVYGRIGSRDIEVRAAIDAIAAAEAEKAKGGAA